MSSTSMSSWMNQPTYAHNHASANNAMVCMWKRIWKIHMNFSKKMATHTHIFDMLEYTVDVYLVKS
jgi:hypothetical protein